jgi:hypothetical protein
LESISFSFSPPQNTLCLTWGANPFPASAGRWIPEPAAWPLSEHFCSASKSASRRGRRCPMVCSPAPLSANSLIDVCRYSDILTGLKGQRDHRIQIGRSREIRFLKCALARYSNFRAAPALLSSQNPACFPSTTNAFQAGRYGLSLRLGKDIFDTPADDLLRGSPKISAAARFRSSAIRTCLKLHLRRLRAGVLVFFPNAVPPARRFEATFAVVHPV